MSLLDNQSAIGKQFPMPATLSDYSSQITAVSGESVQFIVVSTNANDVGSAAGTNIYGRLANNKVTDSQRSRLGRVSDSSFSWGTGTCLTTERMLDYLLFEKLISQGMSRANAIDTLLTDFANGEYCIDYVAGIVYGKKATSATSDTANYVYRRPPTASVSLSVGQTDDVGFTPATDTVLGAGFFADETATDSVDEGDIGAARMTLDRKQITASEHKEDTAHTTGDYGTHAMAVRNDAGLALAGTDGDYIPLSTDAVGALRVTGGGQADDSVFTPATSTVTPIGAFADEVATDLVDEGDVGALRMTLNRRLIGASDYQEDTAHNSGDYGSLSLAVRNDTGATLAGTDLDNIPLSTDATGALRVTGGGVADDSVFTPGTSTVAPAAFFADETLTDSVDEGDVGAARMTLDRKQITASEHPEDAGHTSGEYITLIGAVRKDAAGTLVNADNDRAPLQVDSDGSLRVAVTGGSSGVTDDTAFSVGGTPVTPAGFLADETATDSVDEGDTGAARMTHNRRQINASEVLDDATFGIGTEYVGAVGYLVDETATDSVDEGDIGIARMTANRVPLVTGSQAHDEAISTTNNRPVVIGGRAADPTSLPTAVVAGDASYAATSLQQELLVYLSRLLAGEDQTNAVIATANKPLASSTYAPSYFADFGSNATLNVKITAGNVFALTCHNENASERFIQLHNTATTPAGGAVPRYSFRVPTGEQIVIGTEFFTQAGGYFNTGIAFAFSTTKDTYTAATATEQSTTIHYI